MKNYIVLLSLLFVFGCAEKEADSYLFSYFKDNGQDGLHLAYSEDGLQWTAINEDASVLKPRVGKDKLMRDPCIILGGDNKYHMVWTVSWKEKGIGYASSSDLIHWSEQKFLPVMQDEPEARNCWAPEIFYDENSKEYIIHWATTIPGRFPETDALGDDGYNHRMYYTTTKDFVAFTDTQLFYEPGLNVIDANINKNREGYLMFLKDETLLPNPQKNIRIATSKDLKGPYSTPSEPITSNWVEGPTSIKKNDEWIVYFDRYMSQKIGAVTSSDLMVWKDISDDISFPVGTRHGSVLKVKKSTLKRILSHYDKVKK
ncbi:glycoside hydrolase family 43 protein [Arenibacter sp. 6A1]|uniref:glycoside hydrolase family 43 protein n=1 Tax=Arenibacter sp. 6A1 TaxID=2720391 RepID=UPI0014463B26|nr:glycoside hydrolase family 43 protein [Arenibacter sp. 6A1]NKI26631.1 glycoside hydrolase family 43 protein [Arenibacter sp. 6A1]